MNTSSLENSSDFNNGKERLGNFKIVVATTTHYPQWAERYQGQDVNADQLRGDLAIESILLAAQKGFQFVVVDGGSSSEFLDELHKRDIQSAFQLKKGMSASRRQAFREAMVMNGARVIAWIEPEKVSMVDHLEFAAKPILEDKTDIVIPFRTENSFLTYPLQQVNAEKRFNYWYNMVLQKIGLSKPGEVDFDVSFGPRLFRNTPGIVKLFTTQYTLKPNSALKDIIKPDAYSNAIFFPVMMALELGYRVLSVPIDYTHPLRQTQFETGNPTFEQKRLEQKTDIVRGAIELARFIQKNPQRPSELVLEGTSE